jgi:hypothetical protein
MNKKTIKKIRPLISAFLLLGLVYMGFKFSLYHEVKSLFPNSWNAIEELEVTPSTLDWNAKAFERIDTLTIGNLAIPYSKKRIEVDSVNENGSLLRFADSSAIVCINNVKNPNLDFKKLLLSNQGIIDSIFFQEYLNTHAIGTNYDLVFHVFQLKPSDISWFSSNGEIVNQYALLRLKEMLLANGYQNGFYHFEEDAIKGFLFGDPSIQDRVLIECFTSNKEHYSLMLRGMEKEDIAQILKRISLVN